MHLTPVVVDLESTRLPSCVMTMVEDESSRTITSLLNTDALDLYFNFHEQSLEIIGKNGDVLFLPVFVHLLIQIVE